MIKARRKKQDLATLDPATRRSDPGKPIKLDFRLQRVEQAPNIVEMTKPKKQRGLPIGQLAILRFDTRQNLHRVHPEPPRAIKRCVCDIARPARLRGERASQFNIGHRTSSRHLSPKPGKNPINCLPDRP